MQETIKMLNKLSNDLQDNVEGLHRPFAGMIDYSEEEKNQFREEERQAKYAHDDKLGII